MSVRDTFLPAAEALLAQFGVDVVLTRSVAADATPTAAQKFNRAARSTTTQTVRIEAVAVLRKQTRTDVATGVETERSVVLMIEEPKQGDTLTIGTKSYLVGEVTVTAPQGEAIYYEAEVS